MNRKTIIAWGIKWKTGTILPFSIRLTRREAIKDMESNHNSRWKQLKRQGMAAVKLEIRELQEASLSKPARNPCQPFPQLKLFAKEDRG